MPLPTPRFVMAHGVLGLRDGVDMDPWIDDWAYTTESARLEDVVALNRLFALPAVEGLVLDYPDD